MREFLAKIPVMKYLIVLVYIFCVVIPVHGQAARKDADTNQQKRSEPHTPQPNPSPIVENKFGVPEQGNTTGKSENNSDKSPSYFYRLIAPETLPNLVLCVVGIAGVVAAFYTFKVVREQTGVAKKAAMLQETAMQQWVDIKNWGVKIKTNKDHTKVLNISFDIVNPTSLPLKIRKTKLAIPTRISLEMHNIMLGPHVPFAIEVANVSIDERQVSSYFIDEVVIPLFCCVVFVDCFDKEQGQNFSGNLHCSTHGQTFKMAYLTDSPWAKEATKSA
jgi:hypothetical protein